MKFLTQWVDFFDEFGKKDQLKELIVDSNQLTDECDYPYLQSLMHLSISNNQICDLERLMDKDSLLKYLIESIF